MTTKKRYDVEASDRARSDLIAAMREHGVGHGLLYRALGYKKPNYLAAALASQGSGLSVARIQAIRAIVQLLAAGLPIPQETMAWSKGAAFQWHVDPEEWAEQHAQPNGQREESLPAPHDVGAAIELLEEAILAQLGTVPTGWAQTLASIRGAFGGGAS